MISETPDDVLSLVELDMSLDEKPGCEGPTHPQARYGHIPSQSASWLVCYECGENYLVCDGWVQKSIRSGKYSYIAGCPCGATHLVSRVVVIRLPDWGKE